MFAAATIRGIVKYCSKVLRRRCGQWADAVRWLWAGAGMNDTGPELQLSKAATVTRLLNEAGAGDPRVAAELLPLVYEQLRRLAESKVRREPPDRTLGATALVHEAYLRLVNQDQLVRWDGRWHFFAAAAEAMRRILIEQARRHRQLKRGGGRRRVELDEADLTVDDPPHDLLALDEALAALARDHPRQAQLVKLRYFAGLTTEQAAQALGISVATAGRQWAYARAWLYARLTAAGESE